MLVKRAIAIFIDSIVLGVVYFVIGLALDDPTIIYVITLVIGAAYQWFFLTRNNGQTPGKILLGIRVVTMSGGKVGDLAAVIRYVGYLLNGIFFIGWIVAVITGRGFHDRLAGTHVVDA